MDEIKRYQITKTLMSCRGWASDPLVANFRQSPYMLWPFPKSKEWIRSNEMKTCQISNDNKPKNGWNKKISNN